MNMIYVIKRFNCTIKALALMKYCKEFKDPRAGFSNGLEDLRTKAWMVSGTKAELQRESEEALLSTWFRKFFLSGRSWNLIKLVDLPSLELELRLFIGSLNKEKLVKFPLSPLSPG